MKRILLIGASTSLGRFFHDECAKRGHLVSFLPERYVPDQIRSNTLALIRDDGPVDWVVNCLGRNHLSTISYTPYADEAMLTENVVPVYWVVDSLVSIGHAPCRVLSVASQTYRIAQTSTALYCASKAALVQLSRTMARELAPQGWVINCIAPGKITDTRMARLTDEQVLKLRGWEAKEADEYALRNIPMRRFTNRAEVVEAMFGILALPEYINGTCIDMTGGA